ncbi:LacI family DNA-binding transcriptional regulator [Lacticaseibacillus jixianensis]|uniref:LacI family DNA-binding transcriptional regulator n=1 Tax=Lacticaseibacillus jixianensis TaxID=2486012 RepID=A0ABW4B826_9LACO|nr:LacI family DNA-binding transcriptional regulator [Lacticaseibacillus jixianensis]
MRVTIEDIAKQAGLSVASVSRILNNTGRFSQATAKRVRAIAADLGYYKNRSAADLARHTQTTLGVINYPAETDSNFHVIRGITEEARQSGVDVLIMIAERDDQATIQKVAQDLIERRVFGILFLSLHPDQAIIDLIKRAGIYPQEVASTYALDMSYVSSNDYQMGQLATRTLIEKGYTRIGFVGADPARDIVGTQRFAGYQAALAAAGITYRPEWLFVGDGKYSYQSGLAAVAYYTEHAALDAVFATSDDGALGVINGLIDRDGAFTHQWGIISTDGSQICEQSRPKISSVTQDFNLIGRMAVAEAVRAIDDPPQAKKQIDVPFKLELRETTPGK